MALTGLTAPRRGQWATGLIVMMVAAMVALSGIVGVWATADMRAQAALGLKAQVDLAARDLSNRLDSVLASVESVALDVAVLDLEQNPAQLKQWLQARQAATPGALWLCVADLDGIVRASGSQGRDNVASQPWFKRGLTGTAILDPASVAAVDGTAQRRLDFAAPIRNAAGAVTGVVGMHLRWDQIGREVERITASLRTAPDVGVALKDNAGKILLAQNAPPSQANPVEVEAPVIGRRGQQDLGWHLAVSLPATTLEAAADNLAARVGWLAGAISLAGVIFAIGIARSVARSLADSRAAFSAVENLVPGIVFGATRDGNRLKVTHFASPTGRQTNGNDSAEPMLSLVHPEDRRSLLEAYARAEAVAGQQAAPVEVEVRARLPVSPDDWTSFEAAGAAALPERWLRVALRGRRTKSGQVTVEGVALEVTDIKRTAALEAENRHLAELRAADADRIAQNKAEVLAIMAHEVRTPLTGVLGFSELLCSAPLPAESHQHAEIVHATGSLLLAVVNDILDLAKIEAGKVSIEAIPFQPRAAAEQALTLAGASATQKKLQLNLSVSPDVPEWVMGDPLRFRQIVGNLLGNALKFTEQGGIDARLLITASRPPALRVEIQDTGIGVSPEALGKLFTMFTQAEATTARLFGGTGLGLALCRRLVEAMDGQIGASSTPGKGSLFWFEVPLRPTVTPTPEHPQSDTEPGRALRVLVVDDVATNRLLLGSMLTAMGHSVVMAGSGVEAIAILEDTRVDVVLMDVNMPEMDGLEAARRIRAFPDSRARLPVLALTAGASRADADEAMAAGMTAHIPKPISRATLKAALEQATVIVAR